MALIYLLKVPPTGMQETGNYSSNSRLTERLTNLIQNQIDKMRCPADEEAAGRLHILKSRSQKPEGKIILNSDSWILLFLPASGF